MDEQTKYMTAREFGLKHGRTKAWVIKLCHQNRIEGAYKAGTVWVIPESSPLPEKLTRGRVASPFGTRAERARLAQIKREMAAAFLVEQQGITPQNREKFYLRDVLGFCQMGNYWVRPVWSRDESKPEFSERSRKFKLWFKAGRPDPAPDGYEVKTFIGFDPAIKAKFDELDKRRAEFRKMNDEFFAEEDARRDGQIVEWRKRGLPESEMPQHLKDYLAMKAKLAARKPVVL